MSASFLRSPENADTNQLPPGSSLIVDEDLARRSKCKTASRNDNIEKDLAISDLKKEIDRLYAIIGEQDATICSLDLRLWELQQGYETRVAYLEGQVYFHQSRADTLQSEFNASLERTRDRIRNSNLNHLNKLIKLLVDKIVFTRKEISETLRYKSDSSRNELIASYDFARETQSFKRAQESENPNNSQSREAVTQSSSLNLKDPEIVNGSRK